MRLNEKLRQLRTDNGLFLKDVSKDTGISVPYLSDLERGRTNPSLGTLFKLASFYEVTVSRMLEHVDLSPEGREGSTT